jgi:hypothetical protein
MRYGMRKPSWKKSLSARTTGRAKRAIKRAIIQGYGRRGMGLLHPKRALYNKRCIEEPLSASLICLKLLQEEESTIVDVA